MRDIVGLLRRAARKSRILKKVYQKTTETFLDTHIGEITPLQPRRTSFAGARINLFVPSINQEHMFGGISTALQFFMRFEQSSVKLRIITTDAAPAESDLLKFKPFRLVSSQEDSAYDYEIVPFNDRYNKTIPVSEDDLFMATSWWTAYLIQRIQSWQEETYRRPLKPNLYFIQDYEPGFYAWSSHYALADSTYRYNQIAIFNSSLLKDYFQQEGYQFEHQYFFEPKLNDSLKAKLPELRSLNKRKIILLYGRPSVDRNAFKLIIEALRIWCQIDPATSQWEILSAGEKHATISLTDTVSIVSKGKMALDEYAELLRNAAIGISLMISPHPSYPPLEMAHFGILTITNRYANKDLSSWHDNLISPENCSPDAIASCLKQLCGDFELNPHLGLEGKGRVPLYTQSQDQFPFFGEIETILGLGK